VQYTVKRIQTALLQRLAQRQKQTGCFCAGAERNPRPTSGALLLGGLCEDGEIGAAYAGSNKFEGKRQWKFLHYRPKNVQESGSGWFSFTEN
jgi:hypothetical protein